MLHRAKWFAAHVARAQPFDRQVERRLATPTPGAAMPMRP
jgi:hypothetical protein